MDVFATHLPILQALEPKPTRVLEFGSGNYSTECFLKMRSVRKLVSIEMYADWHDEMQAKFGRYKRWTLLNGTDEVPPLMDFDLVFVDDGRNEQERLASIHRVLSQEHPRVVIHDAEFGPFIAAIQGYGQPHVVHTEYNPHTAVVEAYDPT